jgi:hypothetical protein
MFQLERFPGHVEVLNRQISRQLLRIELRVMGRDSLMKSGNRSTYGSIFPLFVGLLGLVCLFVFISPAPVIQGRTKLSLSFPEFSGFVNLDVFGFKLGLARFPENRIGLGLGLGDKRSASLGNWDLGPLVIGEFSPGESLDQEDLSGGLEANYFDYRIGSWALSSTARVWLRTSGYRIGGNGSFSLGNLSLAFDLQYESGSAEKTSWFPASEGNPWSGLVSDGLPGFERSTGSHLTLYGERRITMGEESLKWSQGVNLDSRGYPGTLGLVTRIGYRKSFILAKVEGLSFSGWAIGLTGDKLSIGFAESSGESGGYEISVGYRGERRIGLTVMRKKYEPETDVTVTIRW